MQDKHAALTEKKETAAAVSEKDSGKQPNIGKSVYFDLSNVTLACDDGSTKTPRPRPLSWPHPSSTERQPIAERIVKGKTERSCGCSSEKVYVSILHWFLTTSGQLQTGILAGGILSVWNIILEGLTFTAVD